MSAPPSFFAERRFVFEERLGKGGERTALRQEDHGLCLTTSAGDERAHEVSLGAPEELVSPLPAAARQAALTALSAERPALPEAAVTAFGQALQAQALETGASRCDVLFHHGVQAVACGALEAPRQERREWVVVELKVLLPDGDSLWRCCSYPTAEAALADPSLARRRLQELLGALHSGPRLPCPDEELPVVLAQGSAATCFFHEVCGHPLEGDVVLRHGSYLAERIGQKVAPLHVSVSDDPTGDGESLAYRYDDEGVEARPVFLFREGVVEEPLLDLRTAARLGRAPNGHGRRVSHRHPPLPRMAHTRVAKGRDDPAALLAGISRGLYVQHLLPRHMNLLSGDFSFYLVEARLIEHGRLGPRVLPGVLRGNGLRALQALEAVANDGRSLLSTRGCRKLDHGPLRVSFGQPTLRFERLRIEPQR